MMINTLTGALAIKFVHERPTSFSEYFSEGMPTLLIMPQSENDFEAVMISERGAVLSTPVMSALVASHAFSLSGLPEQSLSLVSSGERFDVPILPQRNYENAEYPIKCKQIYSKTVVFSGGMEHVLYTDGGKCRTRMIEAPSEIDFSRELLCRLRVMDGLPDTVRSIAYRRVGAEWRMASTDSTLTLDSVVPLVGLVSHLGERGEIFIVCRGIRFVFRVPEGDRTGAYISASLLFPRGT